MQTIKIKKYNVPFVKKTLYSVTMDGFNYVSTKKGIAHLISVITNGGSVMFEMKEVKDEEPQNSEVKNE